MGKRIVNIICQIVLVLLVLSSLMAQQTRYSRAHVEAGVQMTAWTSHPFYFGADYYPEDYSLEQVEQDAASMERANLNLVRVLDSNWSKIEPADGHFTFDWLDRVVGILDKHGIKVLLGVPSYSPPYWLIRARPEMLLIDREGRQYRPGGLGYLNIFDS